MEIILSEYMSKQKLSPYDFAQEFESFLSINPEWQGSSRSIAAVLNDFLASKEKELTQKK